MNDQFKAINEQFIAQAQEFLKASQNIQMPSDIPMMNGDAMEEARKSYAKLETLSKDVTKAMEQVSNTAQKSSLVLNDKITDNIKENSDAIMELVSEISSAKSVQEALQIQTAFVQSQVSKASEQSQELYELGSKMAKDASDQWSKAATKAMNTAKK